MVAHITWPEPYPGEMQRSLCGRLVPGETLTSHVSENASEPGGNNLLEVHVWWDIDDKLKRSHISSSLPHSLILT